MYFYTLFIGILTVPRTKSDYTVCKEDNCDKPKYYIHRFKKLVKKNLTNLFLVESHGMPLITQAPLLSFPVL